MLNPACWVDAKHKDQHLHRWEAALVRPSERLVRSDLDLSCWRHVVGITLLTGWCESFPKLSGLFARGIFLGIVIINDMISNKIMTSEDFMCQSLQKELPNNPGRVVLVKVLVAVYFLSLPRSDPTGFAIAQLIQFLRTRPLPRPKICGSAMGSLNMVGMKIMKFYGPENEVK